jgi:hypothetical protein
MDEGVSAEELSELLGSFCDKRLSYCAVTDHVFMLCFEHGKTIYVTGKDLTLDFEQAQ